MAFPASPSNNDVHKEGNRSFVYDSTLGVWDKVKDISSVPNATAPVILPHSDSNLVEGAMYYDSTSNSVKVRSASGWTKVDKVISLGGTVTTYTSDGVGYVVHTFLSSGFFTSLQNQTVDYLVVAGGGAGGNWHAGGGGGGGFLTAANLSISAQKYTVTIGAGGTGGSSSVGTSGSNSVFGDITATGGGRGGNYITTVAAAGGSGGGGNGTASESYRYGGAGTSGQGNNGGNGLTSHTGGGGGGAGAIGSDGFGAAPSAAQRGGAGGVGENNVMGLNDVDSYTLLDNANAGELENGARYFAGGGAGGSWYGTARAIGGFGGGGDGGYDHNVANSDGPRPGGANTGGGGGGSGSQGNNKDWSSVTGGGSGIVIIRYTL